MTQRTVFLFIAMSVFCCAAAPQNWDRTAENLLEGNLLEAYRVLYPRPVQLRGYAFGDPWADQPEMRAQGVNAVGSNLMWIPTREPEAPNGLGTNARTAEGIIHAASNDLFSYVWVGNWNNGAFPYYPDWFYERFPDMAMVDQNGISVKAGMFGRQVWWPGIEHPPIVEGTRRFIRETVKKLKDQPNLAYWILGGEALYPTYLYPDRWTDYSDNAIRHFRAWLETRYESIQELSEAWREDLDSFEWIMPPQKPEVDRKSLDWFNFRFAAMAERMAWHWKSVRESDEESLAVSCNHGDPFRNMAFSAKGEHPMLYARATDGFETGQIMSGSDTHYFNRLYNDALAVTGKPVFAARLAFSNPDPSEPSGFGSFTPRAARRHLYEALGAGCRHVGLIQWKQGELPDGNWTIHGTPAQETIREIFGEWEKLDAILEGMDAWKPRVGLYIAHPTWTLLGFPPQAMAIHRRLVRTHYPKVQLYDQQVEEGELDGYSAIISPGNSILTRKAAHALRDYVKRGGTLILLGEYAIRDDFMQPLAHEDIYPPEKDTKGRMIRINPGTLVREEAQLLDILKILPNIRPLRIETGDRTILTENVSELTWGVQDTPFDLATSGTVTQSILLEREAWIGLSVGLPTFHNPTAPGDVRLEVRLDSADGEIVGSRIVSATEITDNSWHTVDCLQPFKDGTRLFLSIHPPKGIRPGQLGVWGTRQGVYDQGTLFLREEPIYGALNARIHYRTTAPAFEGIQPFLLTDGLNHLIVLINTSRRTIEFELRPEEFVYATGGPGLYDWMDPIKGEPFIALRGFFSLSMEPFSTRTVYLKRKVKDTEARERIERLEKIVERLEEAKADTPYHRYLLEGARRFEASGEYSKAMACALRGLTTPGLRAAAYTGLPGRNITLWAMPYDAEGREIHGARITCEWMPCFTFHRRLNQIGGLGYFAEVPLYARPLEYDYEKGTYIPYTGPVKALFRMEHEGRTISRFVSWDFPYPIPIPN